MWTFQNIKRILLDQSLQITGSPYHGVGDIYKRENADWKYDVGLDSMEIMQLASYANSFFHVFEMNDAPYLLSSSSVDEWAGYIYNGRQKTNESITFKTSGTSGNSKTVIHPIAFLNREIDFLASIFKEATHIIPFVPSYSIYGFLTTVGLPAKLDIPIIFPSDADWHNLPPASVIVATPFHWNLLVNSLSPGSSCFGISSTSALYNDLYQGIAAKGIVLTELYGSTETAGIGYRKHWQEPFTLFPYWKFSPGENSNEIEDGETNTSSSLVDNIERKGIDTFTVTGRKDNKVKIVGVLADLDHIKKTIGEIPGIKECSISAKAVENETVLSAEICLDHIIKADEHEIKKQIRSVLRPHETPRIITFRLHTEQESKL